MLILIIVAGGCSRPSEITGARLFREASPCSSCSPSRTAHRELRKESCDLPHRPLAVPQHVALPNLHDLPATAPQLRDVSAVALDVAQKLRQPVVLAGLREPSVDALSMLMPEAPMDEDDLPTGGEH